ncbi:ABC transporter permease [Streptomyces sp. NPDC008001]|uniref:ABC transporter permease n=1 Tax=Streptomyces sp. NPDC008001 TaxID=3364804 RepID=UPI0036E468F9
MTAPLTPHDQPSDGQPGPAAPAPLLTEEERAERRAELRAELRQAAVVAAAVAVSGLLLGVLWWWLAPRVPLISDGKAVYLKNSEGEQAIGADGTFALLALGCGAVAAAVVFWLRRRGGVPLVVGLGVGSFLGSLVAWRFGAWLGPTSDVVAAARAAGRGVVFDAPLKLAAKGALLAWPLAAMAVHLVLTALFGPRDEWAPPAEPENPA